MNKLFKKKGFTLIELLVVLAIIGILASIVIAAVSTARAGARDTQRKQDIDNISGAIQLYYQNNGSYPQCPGEINVASWNCLVTALQTSGIMTTVPNDPLGGSARYYYDNYCANPAVTDTQHYRLWAVTETNMNGCQTHWWSNYYVGATNCISPSSNPPPC